MAKISFEKHRQDILRFKSVEEDYKQYAIVLKTILEKAKDLYAPLGFVEARSKKIESFSEKIIRKDKYENPLSEMTDLCGARVIVHFSKQVRELCKFIEQNFEVDIENSLDLKNRLLASEFGYRSIHYVVTIRKDSILNTKIHEKIRGLKAEIQVRTFHEHIWADIMHDRIYKSAIHVTEEWKRESARLAALLEEADNAFSEISDTIDQLATNYQATPHPDKLKNEIDVLNVILRLSDRIDNKNAEQRLKLSRIYNLTGKWELAAQNLEPVYKSGISDQGILAGIYREYGYALYHSGKKDEGLKHLNESLSSFENMAGRKKELALTCKYLAEVDQAEAFRYYSLAHQLSPENPYYFASLLVEQIACKADFSKIDIDLVSSKLNECLQIFRQHISLGIEIPEATLHAGRILFLQSNYQESLETYLNMMKLVMNDQTPVSKEALKYELKRLDKLIKINPFYANCIQGILHLILWLKHHENDSKEFLKQYKSRLNYESDEILIICGISKQLLPEEEGLYRPYLSEALRDFCGTVISGGTNDGLPGIIGKLSNEMKQDDSGKFKTIGYLPERKESNSGYDELVRTEYETYSFLELLTYWTDIIFSPANPQKVIVLGIHGSNLSALEYKLALAIGAKVCLAGKLGGSAQAVAYDPEWKDLPNLYNIPADPYTLWAFVNFEKPGHLSREDINKLAPLMHEFYRLKRLASFNAEKETDINKYRVLMEWDKLSAVLQQSNLSQAAFMEHIFNRGGLVFSKTEHPAKFSFHNNNPALNLMAQLEHGRWNAERLLHGWRFGPKDIVKKRTPYLVAWDELDDETKTYDFDPLRNFPELLMQIGYEVREEKQ